MSPPPSPLVGLDVDLYRSGDERAILDCMRVCFGIEPDAGRWRHLNLEGPAGPSIVVIARRSGVVVSHVALLPQRVVAFRREGLLGHAIDSMTRPEWRGRGVKTALAWRARDLGRERGLLAIVSFANAQALPGIVRYQNRRVVAPLPIVARVLKPLHAVRAVLGSGGAGNIDGGSAPGSGRPPECAAAGPLPGPPADPERRAPGRPAWSAPRFDERHTDLFRDADALPAMAIVRDQPHLTWRYASLPDAPYLQRDIVTAGRLQATAVMRFATLFGLRVALVMEWLWRPQAEAAALGILEEAVALSRAADTDLVAALAMPDTRQRRLLVRMGFLPVPGWLRPAQTTFNVGPETAPPAAARWFTPSDWYLTWGDGLIV
jgi:GNAT superfamily N-acetyltransferase